MKPDAVQNRIVGQIVTAAFRESTLYASEFKNIIKYLVRLGEIFGLAHWHWLQRLITVCLPSESRPTSYPTYGLIPVFKTAGSIVPEKKPPASMEAGGRFYSLKD